MSQIVIVDYGMGNLHSAAKAVEHVSDKSILVSNKPEEIAAAERVIFPGVGAIRDCMHEIKRLGLDEAIREAVQQKPVLGICVGMQALLDFSEENNGVDCLGILSGKVRFFGNDLKDANGEKLKIPHMGWNQVHHSDHPMWADIEQDARFYFVHSYYVELADPSLLAGECEYGVRFAAAATRDNLFAVQFHPEKSARAGLQLLQNFSNWKP